MTKHYVVLVFICLFSFLGMGLIHASALNGSKWFARFGIATIFFCIWLGYRTAGLT